MKKSVHILSFAIAFVAIQSSIVSADVKLPAVISSHMVLQRDRAVVVWGWAAAGEKVRVRFGDRNATGRADGTGCWRVKLPELAASSKPRSMYIEGSSGSRIELSDILVGEVWFCTGPSNIYWAVKKCDNAKEEISSAKFPGIRFFTVKKNAVDVSQKDCSGEWFACSPGTVGDVSGIGYFFCRRIHKELGVPVGMMQSFWGGSRIEAWTSREALEAEPKIKPILNWWQKEFSSFDQTPPKRSRSAKRKAAKSNPYVSRHRPACLYNGMIAPLIPFSMRGMICYQGLGNLFWADYNDILLETFVNDLRTRWAQGDFPVGMVQPAPFDCGKRLKSAADAYSVQREAQLIVQEKLTNIGIAPTLDVDDINVLHFTNKQLVGRRLACWALAKAYGFDIPHAGPVYKSMSVEGNSVRVCFRHTGSGLTTNDGRPPAHFEVAGADGKYHPATAKIDGHTVIVNSPHVAKPVAVRFAFTDTAVVNLTNREGLPASLFRTDRCTVAKTVGKHAMIFPTSRGHRV